MSHATKPRHAYPEHVGDGGVVPECGQFAESLKVEHFGRAAAQCRDDVTGDRLGGAA